jgi:hypothetical protein
MRGGPAAPGGLLVSLDEMTSRYWSGSAAGKRNKGLGFRIRVWLVCSIVSKSKVLPSLVDGQKCENT